MRVAPFQGLSAFLVLTQGDALGYHLAPRWGWGLRMFFAVVVNDASRWGVEANALFAMLMTAAPGWGVGTRATCSMP